MANAVENSATARSRPSSRADALALRAWRSASAQCPAWARAMSARAHSRKARGSPFTSSWDETARRAKATTCSDVAREALVRSGAGKQRTGHALHPRAVARQLAHRPAHGVGRAHHGRARTREEPGDDFELHDELDLVGRQSRDHLGEDPESFLGVGTVLKAADQEQRDSGELKGIHPLIGRRPQVTEGGGQPERCFGPGEIQQQLGVLACGGRLG